MSRQCNCDEALAVIYLYLDRELTWWRRRQIRRHLAECPPCLRGFEFEKRLKRVVRERLYEEVPTDLVVKLRAVIQAEVNPPPV